MKKVLIVNTASECGYTPQYKDLEALYEKYKSKNFVVIGFPCNDFGGQEPGTSNDIKAFCTKNYGVTFQMMEKVSIATSPIYKWLTSKAENGVLDATVKWNFNKFLIDEKGQLVKYLPSNTKILNIVPADNLQYKIIMQVNNKDIAQVKEGQVVYYEFLALPYKEYGNFKGTITKVGIDSSIEEKNPTKSYLVEANIEHKAVFNQKGEQGDLKVGMNCDVRIVTKSKKIINYLLEKINLRE